ncbi:MAG: HEAT repeat domain-containing protein [Planctomycetota bacterium]
MNQTPPSETARCSAPDAACRAHRTIGSGRARVALLCLLPALLALLGPVAAQTPPPLLAELIRSDDAATRGEAALLLGALKEDGARELLRTLRDDPDRTVRMRAVIALGALAEPGVEAELGTVLENRDAEKSLREAAAYALGSLPEGQPAPAVDHFLTRVQGGSLRRWRDEVAALLAGFGRGRHPDRRAQIESFLRDQSLRDAGLLAIAARALQRSGGHTDPTEILRLLRLEDQTLRTSLIEGLAAVSEPNEDLRSRIVDLARSERDPVVRASALRALRAKPLDRRTRELAARALATGHPTLVEAAVEVLSGAGAEEDLALVAGSLGKTSSLDFAILAGWQGTPTQFVLDRCRKILAELDEERTGDRLRALELLARAREREVEAELRRILARGTDSAELRQALLSLRSFDANADAITSFGSMADANKTRWTAVIEAVAAVDPSASRSLARDFFAGLKDASAEQVLEVLSTWRRVAFPPPQPTILAGLSAELALALR